MIKIRKVIELGHVNLVINFVATTVNISLLKTHVSWYWVLLTYQCSRSKPSYEFHFEGVSNFSPSVERLVQIQDVDPKI